MKYIKTLVLAVLLVNICYPQKSKIIAIGAIADFPISKKANFDNGFGAEVSLISGKKNVSKLIFTFSYLEYQYSDLRFPSGAPVAYYLKTQKPLYKLTAGKLIKATGNLFFNVVGGFVFDNSSRQSTNTILMTLIAGPTLILPIKEKYCVKLASQPRFVSHEPKAF